MQFFSPNVIRDLSQTHVIYSGAASGPTGHAPVVGLPVIPWLPYCVTVTALRHSDSDYETAPGAPKLSSCALNFLFSGAAT